MDEILRGEKFEDLKPYFKHLSPDDLSVLSEEDLVQVVPMEHRLLMLVLCRKVLRLPMSFRRQAVGETL